MLLQCTPSFEQKRVPSSAKVQYGAQLQSYTEEKNSEYKNETSSKKKKTYNKYTPHREYPISDLVCRRRTSITASRPCKESWPWLEQVALGRYHTASKASLDIEGARTFVLSNFSFINLNNRTRGSESPGVFIGIQRAISGDLGSSSQR